MPALFSAVRTALASRAQTVDGIKQALAREPDSIGATPCAIVRPAPGDTVDYLVSMGDDECGYLLVVSVYVQSVAEGAAQDVMDAFILPTGASSVRAAINGTLGGVVRDATVTAARNYRTEERDEARYLVVDFVVQVMA